MVEPIKEKNRSMEGFALRNQQYLTKAVPVEFSGRMFSTVSHNLSVHFKRFQHLIRKIWQSVLTGDLSKMESKSNEKITRKLTKKIEELNKKIYGLNKDMRTSKDAIKSSLFINYLLKYVEKLNNELESIKGMQEIILPNNSIDQKVRNKLQEAYKTCSSDIQFLGRILHELLEKASES